MGGRFDSREGVLGPLLLPKGEPVGGYVFSDEDCKICINGEEGKINTTERRCSFGFFIALFVSRNAFIRWDPKEIDRGLR